jgi:MFS transporter, DHA1 family, multidrug resistance protein
VAVDQPVNDSRNTLFLRLSVILFFAELAHGMLLYGIIPDLVQHRFPREGLKLFGVLPVKEEVAGLCLAAYTLAELFSKVAAGHWVDRKGPDAPLRVGLLLSFATVPIILLSKNPTVMLVGAFLHGIAAAPVWPAVISAWTQGRSAKERGEIMGQILTGWMAGLGLGVISGKFLVALSGRAELAATCAPLGMWMITVGAALWTGRRLGYPAGHGEEGEREGLLAQSFPPELKVMAIGLFLQNLAFGALILPFNFLAETHFLLNPAQVGLVFLLGGGPTVLLLGPMGKLSDRVGRRNSVIGAIMVVAPLIVVAPFLKYLDVDPWIRLLIMIPGLLVAGVAYAFLLPAWHALALGRIPEQQRGRSLALLMSVEMAALAGGHALGTPIYTKVSFAAPFVFAGVTFGILGIVYLLGYILPPELPDEPHPVDLSKPVSPNGSIGSPLERPRDDAAGPRSPHSAG